MFEFPQTCRFFPGQGLAMWCRHRRCDSFPLDSSNCAHRRYPSASWDSRVSTANEHTLFRRFPQKRHSKRHPGKFRWVLYEMWPLADPVTHKQAVLVCEQNISQVRAVEDQFKTQNERWVWLSTCALCEGRARQVWLLRAPVLCCICSGNPETLQSCCGGCADCCVLEDGHKHRQGNVHAPALCMERDSPL